MLLSELQERAAGEENLPDNNNKRKKLQITTDRYLPCQREREREREKERVRDREGERERERERDREGESQREREGVRERETEREGEIKLFNAVCPDERECSWLIVRDHKNISLYLGCREPCLRVCVCVCVCVGSCS